MTLLGRVLLGLVGALSVAFPAFSEDQHSYALVSLGQSEVWYLDLKSVNKNDPTATSFWLLVLRGEPE